MSLFGKKNKQDVSIADRIAQYNAKFIAEQEALKVAQAKPVQVPTKPAPVKSSLNTQQQEPQEQKQSKDDLINHVNFAMNLLNNSDAENATAALELMKQIIPDFDENSPQGKKLMESLFGAKNHTNENGEPNIETLHDIPVQFFINAENFLENYVCNVADEELKELLLTTYDEEEPPEEFLKIAAQINKIFISFMTIEGYEDKHVQHDTERLKKYITQKSLENPIICSLLHEYPNYAVTAIVSLVANNDEKRFESAKAFAVQNYFPILKSIDEHVKQTIKNAKAHFAK